MNKYMKSEEKWAFGTFKVKRPTTTRFDYVKAYRTVNPCSKKFELRWSTCMRSRSCLTGNRDKIMSCVLEEKSGEDKESTEEMLKEYWRRLLRSRRLRK